jgi:hypothetical protein
MQFTRNLFVFAAICLAQPALAGELPLSTPSPFGEIQTQLDELAARTQALEDSAPDSSVEGRTYCFNLDLLIMRGRAANGTEELQTNVIRRTAVFSGGLFTGSFLSNVLNNQRDNGAVIPGLGNPIDPLLATYTQSGNKVDITFTNGTTANWYVSKDGSVIHGSTISHLPASTPLGLVTFGFLRNWTLVENDTCDMEGQ